MERRKKNFNKKCLTNRDGKIKINNKIQNDRKNASIRRELKSPFVNCLFGKVSETTCSYFCQVLELFLNNWKICASQKIIITQRSLLFHYHYTILLLSLLQLVRLVGKRKISYYFNNVISDN
jgi:hypothetical protein